MQGEQWLERTKPYYRHKDDGIENLSAFQAFNPEYWKRRAEVVADPGHNTASGVGKVSAGTDGIHGASSEPLSAEDAEELEGGVRDINLHEPATEIDTSSIPTV
jgi:hypothetical protein